MRKKEGDKDDVEISEKSGLICLILRERLNGLNDLIFKDNKNGSK